MLRKISRAAALFISGALAITLFAAPANAAGTSTLAASEPLSFLDADLFPVSEMNSFERPAYLLERRDIRLPNGDAYWSRLLTFKGKYASVQKDSFSIPGSSGTMRFYDPTFGKWITKPLSGQFPRNTIVFADTDRCHMIISPARNYFDRGFDSIEEVYSGATAITAAPGWDGYNIEVSFDALPGTVGRMWAVRSDQPLVNWTDETSAALKMHFDLAAKRWEDDGFYMRSPDTYLPHGLRMFWRNPSAILMRGLSYLADCRGAADLAVAMCVVTMGNQNAEGYWPTGPISTWLMEDYGIGTGFYDTRFNTDATMAFIVCYRRFGDPRYLETAKRQAGFFLKHAAGNHYTVTGDGGEGWLVYDYEWPGNGCRPSHTSLNHQAAEVFMLLNLYQETGDEEYIGLADKMMLAVDITAGDWILPDGNLHYAYLPDGSMGLRDYPNLTYNDLFDLAAKLRELYLPAHPSLGTLMASKLEWMKANNITGYKAG